MPSLIDRFAEQACTCDGRVGAVILSAEGEEALALDPDGTYPAASVIKLPLLMTLYADAHDGRVALGDRIAVGERVEGSGVLRDLRDVEAMSLRDLAVLAVTVSDNTATNRLIEVVGPDRVTERLVEWGCPTTRLRRRMYDLEARARGLENVMTPRETASLLLRVLRGARAGDEAMASVLALLERNTNTLRLGRYLPEGVTLAHKDGWIELVDNDAGVVTAERPVVVAGFTAGLAPIVARPLLGLLGLAAAELAGARVRSVPAELVAG